MRILLIGQGYIGSYLTVWLRDAGHEVVVCSTSFGLPEDKATQHVHSRYQDLETTFLAGFDHILWFAGHSSVAKATQDPFGAIRNNCVDLLDLAQRKPQHIPLIYASSASLYSEAYDVGSTAVPKPRNETEALMSSLNAYDSSKAAFDALVRPLALNTCGLRLGTLCGHSPRMRYELVFNAMNLSAMQSGTVNVANRGAWRSLLFLEDLAAVIDALLTQSNMTHRFINLASFDIQIGDLADQIAAFHGAKLELLPDTETYSFRMDTQLMSRFAAPATQTPLDARCDTFVQAVSSDKRSTFCEPS